MQVTLSFKTVSNVPTPPTPVNFVFPTPGNHSNSPPVLCEVHFAVAKWPDPGATFTHRPIFGASADALAAASPLTATTAPRQNPILHKRLILFSFICQPITWLALAQLVDPRARRACGGPSIL